MAISTELGYAELDKLKLDPMNPRMGRNNKGPNVPQEQVLDIMTSWALDELAISYLDGGGFWTHEALLVTREELYGESHLVVIEGNRRLAALKCLYEAYYGESISSKWQRIAASAEHPPNLFTKIPYIFVDTREEIDAFLGFRHVTGIKEWDPAEKAAYIVRMIDERGMTYEQVMRMIGSKTPNVRRNYISYRLLLQMEDSVERFSSEDAQGRFSVMYLALRTRGVQHYLNIDIEADPETAHRPVPQDHLDALANFARWLFGNDKRPPLFTDSRKVYKFNQILSSDEAVQYLERTERPNFDFALRIAGGDEPEIVELIEAAADNVEQALGRVHLYKGADKIKHAVARLGAHVTQLLNIFPGVREELEGNKS